MARPTSMTRKLVTALTSVVAISWFIACGLGVMVMQDEFAEIFDAGVEETAERLLPLLVDDLRENNTGPASQKLNQSAHAAEYLTYQVRDREGQVVLHSHDSSTEPFEVSLDPGFSETATQRIYTVATPDGNYFLQVADAFANRREAIEEAGTAILLPVLILIPASIFAVIFVVRKTLQPIQTLRDEIGKKDGGNLAPLETLPFPAELHPIARSVNLLLRRLRSTIEAEREFTANSAHELRTPIAGALAQAQRLHADIPPELAPRVENIEKALMHLGHLAEKLLQMSRAEARIGGNRHGDRPHPHSRAHHRRYEQNGDRHVPHPLHQSLRRRPELQAGHGCLRHHHPQPSRKRPDPQSAGKPGAHTGRRERHDPRRQFRRGDRQSASSQTDDALCPRPVQG